MLSNKKTMGTIGCVFVYVIGLVAVIKDPSTVGAVLKIVTALVVLLYGIKSASGTILQHQIIKEEKKEKEGVECG